MRPRRRRAARCVDVPGDLAAGARAHPEQLQRVLFNLIQNAIRHTPADGSVTVRAAAAGERRARSRSPTPARDPRRRPRPRLRARSSGAARRARTAAPGSGSRSRARSSRRTAAGSGSSRRRWARACASRSRLPLDDLVQYPYYLVRHMNYLDDDVGFLLAKATQRWNELLLARFTAAGFPEIRGSFGSVLLPLFDEDGLRIGEIARRARLSKPSMTALIAQCEAAGLVGASTDPADGRAFRVVLTDNGRRSSAWQRSAARPRRSGAARRRPSRRPHPRAERTDGPMRSETITTVLPASSDRCSPTWPTSSTSRTGPPSSRGSCGATGTTTRSSTALASSSSPSRPTATGVIDMYAGPIKDEMALFPTRVVALPDGRSRLLLHDVPGAGYARRAVRGQHASLQREFAQIERQFARA